MNTEKRIFDIVDGPSRDTLFDACKYAYSKAAQVPVYFGVVFGQMPKNHPDCGAHLPMSIKDVKITGIEHEDGSGESFNLHGYCNADLNFMSEDATYATYKFEAYYNAKSRDGWITFS